MLEGGRLRLGEAWTTDGFWPVSSLVTCTKCASRALQMHATPHETPAKTRHSSICAQLHEAMYIVSGEKIKVECIKIKRKGLLLCSVRHIFSFFFFFLLKLVYFLCAGELCCWLGGLDHVVLCLLCKGKYKIRLVGKRYNTIDYGLLLSSKPPLFKIVSVINPS